MTEAPPVDLEWPAKWYEARHTIPTIVLALDLVCSVALLVHVLTW